MASTSDSAVELPSPSSTWYCGKCARYGVKTEITLTQVRCHKCEYTVPSEVVAIDSTGEARVDQTSLNQAAPTVGSFRLSDFGTLNNLGTSNWGVGNSSGLSLKNKRDHTATQATPTSAGVGKSFDPLSHLNSGTGGGTFLDVFSSSGGVGTGSGLGLDLSNSLASLPASTAPSILDCAAEALTSLSESTHNNNNNKASRSDVVRDERRAESATQMSSEVQRMFHVLASVERKCPNTHCRGATWSANDAEEARCKKCYHFFPTKRVSRDRDSKVCECWLCGTLFFKENGLIEHFKTKHEGQKPFCCRLDPTQKICARKFTTKHNREKHEANECKTIINPIRKFKCPYPECAEHPGYKRVAELKNHTTTKHEGNPKHVKCFVESCTSCFANLSNRNKHAKRVHPLEWALKQSESARKRKLSGSATSRAKRKAPPKKVGKRNKRNKSDGSTYSVL